jgi:hypothetical protein
MHDLYMFDPSDADVFGRAMEIEQRPEYQTSNFIGCTIWAKQADSFFAVTLAVCNFLAQSHFCPPIKVRYPLFVEQLI